MVTIAAATLGFLGLAWTSRRLASPTS